MKLFTSQIHILFLIKNNYEQQSHKTINSNLYDNNTKSIVATLSVKIRFYKLRILGEIQSVLKLSLNMIGRLTVLTLLIGVSLGFPTKDSTCELSKELKEEIQGYKPVVNKIIDSIVNGEFKGDTHKRYIFSNIILGIS